jgi:hypothetical protein
VNGATPNQIAAAEAGFTLTPPVESRPILPGEPTREEEAARWLGWSLVYMRRNRHDSVVHEALKRAG